jgi:hypothetical protein
MSITYPSGGSATSLLCGEPVGTSRFFNTTGPCTPLKHYMLPPEARLRNAQLDRYIESELYWVLHAPRQTGKTTFLQAWMRYLNTIGEVVACYVSIERCQGFEKIEQTNIAIVEAIIGFARVFLPPEAVPTIPTSSPGSLLTDALSAWAAQVAPKPLVVLFDEVDTLSDQPMISFLRQLRSGFATRGIGTFPVSIALVGMRDLRDYLIQSKNGVAVNPGSPFNIKEDSASLSNFTRENVHALVGQHTFEKGQSFEPPAIDLIYDLTRGQPWLVNALAKKCVWKIVPQETKQTVTVANVREAKEMLIQDRAVHLDSLGERLKLPSVRRVIEAVLAGATDVTIGRADRDVEFCFDLGLITWEDGLRIANPIYQEIIPRILGQNYQDNIPSPEFAWQKPDGSLDMAALLKEFQEFWRWHADDWERTCDYAEVFPHLVLMAFLQRVLNGGGRLEREYAVGRARMDLAVEWHGRWIVIEIKLVHPKHGRDRTLQQGLQQTAAYRDRTGAVEAYLLLFDRRPEARTKPWEERLTWETRAGITIVGG